MQIHELNNYSGDLDSNAYLAVDDGSDTGKVSVTGLLADTNAEITQLDTDLNGRIDNIIAGGTAPSASEIVDARRGADGVDYASLGTAIRTQVTNLKSALSGVADEVNNVVYNIREGYESLTFTITNNKRAGIYDGVVDIRDATNALNLLTADVNEGEIISISARCGTAFPTYVFADASNNGIIQVNLSGGVTPKNVSYFDVVVPSGATKMYINGSYIYPLYAVKNIGSVQRTKELVDNLVSKINAPSTTVTTTKTAATRFKIDSNGFITTESAPDAIDLYVCNCDASDVLYVTGRFNPYFANIRFADEYDYVVGAVDINEGTGVAQSVTDYKIVAPSKARKVYINISYISTLTMKKGDVPTITGDYFPNVVTVGKNGTADYSSINSAVSAVADGGTILVFPAIYTEQVEAWGKTVHIIGLDKATCIIKDSSSDYRTPTVEIGAGSLQNLTLIEDHSNPDESLLTGDDTDGRDWNYQRAYTVHIEDYTAHDKELLISNCIISNTLRAAVGCGLYNKQKVRIENCDIWSGVPTRTVDVRRGALYFHNYSGTSQSQGLNASDQIFEAVNNRIECDDDFAMTILDAGANGATSTMDVTFINNMVYSEISGKADSIIHFTKSYPSNNNITITGKSYNNNVSILNA